MPFVSRAKANNQGKRIKVNGKGGGWSQPLVTKLVAYTTIWGLRFGAD
jgi:hypothetical protein